MDSFSLYVHLIPQTTQLIQETIKVTCAGEDLINNLRVKILKTLENKNDGNKVYKVTGIAVREESDSIALNRQVSSYFEDGEDVFCRISIEVDKTKHVKPVATKTVVSKAPVGLSSDDKYITIVKYSFYESGKKWVRVILDMPGIKAHDASKITVDFVKRKFTLRVHDWKGQNYQFTVPRLQCYITPEESTITIKADSIVVNLRKVKDDDNWYSLFKTKAIGEIESD